MGWFKKQLDGISTKMVADTTGDAFNDKELTIVTRARIARLLVLWFLIALVLSVVFVIIYNIAMFYLTEDTSLFVQIETVIPLVWSIIGAPLGFVMGYYFKGNGDE